MNWSNSARSKTKIGKTQIVVSGIIFIYLMWRTNLKELGPSADFTGIGPEITILKESDNKKGKY